MKIAFATIGEAPRDDLVPYLRKQLPPMTEVIEDGVLNALSSQERLALDAGDSSIHMVTRDQKGNSYRLNYQRTLPHMQRVVDGLSAQGANLVVIICGADWTPIRSSVPVINPGKLFPNLIQALGANLKLGVIKPDSGQIPHTVKQYTALGLDPVVTAASPYQPDRLERARKAGEELKAQNVDLIWLTCVGMDEEFRGAVRSVLPKPTILARSILAHVINELLTESMSTGQKQVVA